VLQTVSRVVLTGTRSKPLALAVIFFVHPLGSAWGAPVMTIAIKRLTADADRTAGLALPGVRLVTWTIAAVINWCLRPYALPGVRLVTRAIPVVIN
jgi:hypothetical protein